MFGLLQHFARPTGAGKRPFTFVPEPQAGRWVKPTPVPMMVRVYGPDDLFMTRVPRHTADKMITEEYAKWVNEDAIRILPWTSMLVKGPGLTHAQKVRRRK